MSGGRLDEPGGELGRYLSANGWDEEMREIVEAGKPSAAASSSHDDDDPMLARRRGSSSSSVRSPRVHNILRAAAEEVEGLRREEALASIAGVRSPCAGCSRAPP